MTKFYRIPDTFQKSTGPITTTQVLYNVQGTNQVSLPSGSNPYPTGYPIDTSGLTPAKGFIENASVSYVSDFSKKTRNKPIQEKLFQILTSAAQAARVKVVIFSGGQPRYPAGPRLGSIRHDLGYAADIDLFTKILPTKNATEAALARLDAGGTFAENVQVEGPLKVEDPRTAPVVIAFAQACFEAGATAIGAGNGYMGGDSLHVDIAYGNVTSNPGTHWGVTNGNESAAGWLKKLAAQYPVNRNT